MKKMDSVKKSHFSIDKFLFLDVDGVLNSNTWYREEWDKDHCYPQGDFDPVCVERINKVVRETGCKVVVSSSWRTDNNLQQVFNKVGLDFTIYDITPFGDHRGKEIQDWLDTQTEPYVYAIVDDDREMLKSQKQYVVRTNGVIGITDEDADQLINLLNRTDMINDKLNGMIMQAMKDRDTRRTTVYRAIKTAFTNYTAAKGAKPLDEAAEITILNKMYKERIENQAQYEAANRPDLAAEEYQEAMIIDELLPDAPTDEELSTELDRLLAEQNWEFIPKKEMGKAIQYIKSQYPAADGKKISELVKQRLE